jgi:glycosyltransferase involved in cell wall biosynthesis
MKNVLILAYDFPPYNSIGGQRPYAWYLYFHEFNIKPSIITRQWNIEAYGNQSAYHKAGMSNQIIVEKTTYGEIHYTSYKPNFRDKLTVKKRLLPRMLAKLFTLLQILTDPFLFVFDNKKGIYKYANRLLKTQSYDYIMVSGEPFVLFRYASKLSKKYKIPWIADYRDGWSWNHTQNNKLLKCYLKIWEKQLTKTAWCITTVSKSFQVKLKTLFPKTPVHVIYNGYFGELFRTIETKETNYFRIAFSGTLYSYQPIELFFNALKAVPINQFPKHFEIIFYGLKEQKAQKARVETIAKSYPHWNIRLTDKYSQTDLISSLNEASICLLPANTNYPQIYAKVFEYIALNKPILYFQPDGLDLDDILENYPNVLPCETEQEITQALMQCFVNPKPHKSTKQTQYTRQYQISRLAALLS